MRRQTILTIIAVLIVLIGLGVAVFFVFFSNKKPAVSVTSSENPFGEAGTRTPPTSNTTGPVEGAGTVVAPHLIRIAEGPVAKGAVALPTKAEAVASGTLALADTEVRYIERASGNIYSFRVHDRTLTRTSNKTLPGVLEAAWLPDGSRAFARFLTNDAGVDRVATYALSADGSEGFFLEANLVSVGAFGSTSMFSLLPSANGSVATLASASGANARTLFTSPMSAITLKAAGTNFVATTKPAATMDGYAFLVNGKTGVFSRILGPFSGLVTLPDPTGAYVLYSYTQRGKGYLAVFDVTKRTITQLPVATIADKCAWAAGSREIYCGVPQSMTGTIPDDWYQGATSFTDRLWKINLDTRLATLIADPGQLAQVSLDMVSLTIDRANDVLVFTNKKDGSLWVYDF